jgi:uncharacterized membrane protein
MEDAAFFLHCTAICENAVGFLFKMNKIEEPEWLNKSNPDIIDSYVGLSHSLSRVRMQAAHNRNAEFTLSEIEGFCQRSQPILDIHILSSVQCNQEIFVRV